jgi:hypothetical protein
MMREELLIQAMRNSILRNVKISPQEVKAFYDSIPFALFVRFSHCMFTEDAKLFY